jgi:hypothetical protein
MLYFIECIYCAGHSWVQPHFCILDFNISMELRVGSYEMQVFEVFTAVSSRIPVSWDVTSRRWLSRYHPTTRRQIPEDWPGFSCCERVRRCRWKSREALLQALCLLYFCLQVLQRVRVPVSRSERFPTTTMMMMRRCRRSCWFFVICL